MNKYTAIGLLAATAEGKRIIVLSPRDRAARDAVDEVRAIAPDLHWQLTQGDYQVTLPSGGSIRFLSDNHNLSNRLRGTSADVVMIEDYMHLNTDMLNGLYAVIATSPHGEIVRY